MSDTPSASDAASAPARSDRSFRALAERTMSPEAIARADAGTQEFLATMAAADRDLFDRAAAIDAGRVLVSRSDAKAFLDAFETAQAPADVYRAATGIFNALKRAGA